MVQDGHNAQGQEQEKDELETLLREIGERFEVDFKPLTFNDSVFEVLDVNNMRQYLDRLVQTKALKNPLKDLPLWAKIWPGSFVLETYLRKKVACAGKSLLELGAGCAVLSILASRLGFSHITASDVEDMALLFARANVLRNNLQEQIDVRHIDVTRPGVCPGFPRTLTSLSLRKSSISTICTSPCSTSWKGIWQGTVRLSFARIWQGASRILPFLQQKGSG